MAERRLDPEPWRRCRCVVGLRPHRDPRAGRCPLPATAEDGLCDHCRAEVCPLAGEPYHDARQCCVGGPGVPPKRYLLDRPDEPCYEPTAEALAWMGAMEACDG